MIEELQAHLRTTRLGRVAEHHAVIDSTNRRALDWAEAGAPHGALVTADHQTAGRGRMGRTWTDEPGHNLMASVVLRPQIGPERLALLGLAAALAVAAATKAVATPLEPRVKWPNDVLLDGRKVAGILPEARSRDRDAVVALGLGVNVNQVDFEDDLEATATSIRLELGRPIPRAPLLARLLLELERWVDDLAGDGGRAIPDVFAEAMLGRGATVAVVPPAGPPVTGIARGVAPTGALLLETPAGLHEFHSGDVSLRLDRPDA